MYAGNLSFNTQLFTGSGNGAAATTATANYAGGYMGSVPSRPQSASSFLSLVCVCVFFENSGMRNSCLI